MTFGPSDTMHLLLALAAILSFAHGLGYVFRYFRHPPVIGEILGGLLLGPTLLGAVWPELYASLFVDHEATRTVLGALYQLGLLLLMFCSGMEIGPNFRAGEKRTVLLVTACGTLLPFALGVGALRFVDAADHMGPAGEPVAFAIVFAVAIAVTSIPVISRILHDLDILETPFARIVLSSAVVEDVVLYVLLAIALSMVGTGHGDSFGLPALLGISGATASGMAYYVAATAIFLALSLVIGGRAYRVVERFRYNLLRRGSPVAHMLTFLLAMAAVSLFLGIAPMFGAFLAGIAVGAATGRAQQPGEAIKSFSFAFFIPVYFAIVGLRLDLLTSFDPVFFAGFLVFCCLAKAASVFLGARLARETRHGAVNLAVALNARGGPGIVLASLAFDAGIIDQGFYAVLVMLAIVTSLLAGSWLERTIRRGLPLR